MRTISLALGAVTTALLFGLTGCGHSSDSAKPSLTGSAQQTMNPAAVPSHSATPISSPPALLPPRPTSGNGLTDVDCGPVDGSNGKAATVIAVATANARVGCTEAVTVAVHYVGTPRSADAATVDGWTCAPQQDPATPYRCVKDDRLIDLRGGGGPAAPTASAIPSRTPTGDVNCGPVTDAGGGTHTVMAVNVPGTGQVGCTEAINVASEYASHVSNSTSAVVSGWHCDAQPDPKARSRCTKNGLVIDLLDQ
ncbi:hypothetical protein [Nocardia sp. NPDC051570]|uniref:hypothetical protein n=1 Tax=Nocardia sp. NPDC051570 TaxID=3364324 RepID=UPI003787F944